MTNFKIQTLLDKITGRYFIQVYKEGEDIPFVISDPVFLSHEHALAEATDAFKKSYQSAKSTL